MVHQVVVEHTASESWVFECLVEQDLLCFGFWDHALGSVSDTTSVVLSSDCSREDILVVVHWLSQNFVPFSESNHDVPWHCHIRFEEDCTHWNNAGKHELHTRIFVTGRQCVNGLAGVLEGRLVLTFEHSTPDDEVVVVHSVELVELRFITGQFDVSIVGFNRGNVTLNGFFPLANPCINVRWHVNKVAETWHQVAQDVCGWEGLFWER